MSRGWITRLSRLVPVSYWNLMEPDAPEPAHAALRRAAQRARELARQTGTVIVISRQGVIEHLQPQPELASTVQEATPPYGDT